MRPYGKGILPASQIYFYDASAELKRMFFYPLCVGHYATAADYIVSRASYDSYLMLYVKHGRAYYLDQDHERVELKQDGFALIDCYAPHEYGAIEPCELYWVHFDGPTARDVCGSILRKGNFLPRNLIRCRDALISLYDHISGGRPLEAALANRMIVEMLTEFLLIPGSEHSDANAIIEDVRGYILDHLDEDLSLEVLSRRANLSPFHFARTFKRCVGVSPHDFLLDARMNLAVFYLLSSDEPVKSIARACGFSTECGFCSAFKRRLGSTPTAYRKRQR